MMVTPRQIAKQAGLDWISKEQDAAIDKAGNLLKKAGFKSFVLYAQASEKIIPTLGIYGPELPGAIANKLREAADMLVAQTRRH
jgi:hypothetical protein